jgi:hypothetical protein
LSFHKTGIFLLNPAIILESAYAPALNTTAQPALIIALVLPSLIAPVPTLASTPNHSNSDPIDSEVPLKLFEPLPYQLAEKPVLPVPDAPVAKWHAYAYATAAYLDQCEAAVTSGYAWQVLMNHDNGTLCCQLHDKQGAKRPWKELADSPCHMTGDESLKALKLRNFCNSAKDFGSGLLKPVLVRIKELQKTEKARVKEAAAAEKAEERRLTQEL